MTIVFGQTLGHAFVNYDDDLYVYENPDVTGGLAWHNITGAFIHPTGQDEWYPLTEISHMLDWQLYGAKAGGHHLTNVLLHAANAIVLFLLLRKMTRAVWCSAFVAAVFAIHPLRVESVAWVAERKDVLSGFFFMLTLWMWLRYIQKRSSTKESEATLLQAFGPRHWTWDYYLALIFFVLGLLSKTILVTLPLVLLLLDYWPLQRLFSPDASRSLFRRVPALIWEKTPFLLLSAAAGVVTILTQQDVVKSVQGLTISWRIGNALLAYVDYLWHMIYPVGLSLLYSHPDRQLSAWQVSEAALLLLAISAAIVMARKKYPYLLVGWLWYLIMLLPVIGAQQVGDQARADRYTYLPQIGLYIAIAWFVVEMCHSWNLPRPALGFAAGIILIGLTADAYALTTSWKNSVTLWTRTLPFVPQSSVAHCNLGIALAAQGDWDDAVIHFNQALQISPNDARSMDNLGKVLIAQKKPGEALQYFDRALQLDPNDVKAVNNSGVALGFQGKVDDAIRHYRHALELDPRYAEAGFNLGNAYFSQGKLDDAIQAYQHALQIKPAFAEAQCNWGLALARQGKMDDAMQHYQQALQISPDYAAARDNLAAAETVQKKLDDAADYYSQALQRNPNDPDALNNLGVVHARQGRLDEAIQDFNHALQINPTDASTHNNLGITLASQGKKDDAIQQFQQALTLAEAQNKTALAESIRKRIDALQPVLIQP